MQFPLLIVLATQRSGSNMLRSMLAATGTFTDFNEVFHEHPDSSFFRYRTRVYLRKPELIRPIREHIHELADGFFVELSEKLPPHHVGLVDIKYNSIHHLNPVWHSPVAPPYLFTVLKRLDLPVLHLVREDLFATFVSHKVAIANKTFNVTHNSNYQPMPIQLNPSHMLASLRLMEQERQWIRKSLCVCPRVREVTYEDLCASGWEVLTSALTLLLGRPIVHHQEAPQYKKVIQGLSTVIENYDEVIAVLQSSEFSRYVPCSDASSVAPKCNASAGQQT